MSDYSIRARRADEYELLADEAYDIIEDQIVTALRTEWAAEFGADNPHFPFKPNMADVHREVEKRLAQQREE